MQNNQNVRTFGIEIEAVRVNNSNLKREIQRLQFELKIDGAWNVVLDGSVTDRRGDDFGGEVVSPVFEFSKLGSFEEELKLICAAIVKHGGGISDNCGLHIHVGLDGNLKNAFALKNLIKNYRDVAEPAIDQAVRFSRRENNNTYCGTLKDLRCGLDAKIIEKNLRLKRDKFNVEGLGETSSDVINDRYRKLNVFSAIEKHGTIEFRHFDGTLNPQQIMTWIEFVQEFVNESINPVSETELKVEYEDVNSALTSDAIRFGTVLSTDWRTDPNAMPPSEERITATVPYTHHVVRSRPLPESAYIPLMVTSTVDPETFQIEIVPTETISEARSTESMLRSALRRGTEHVISIEESSEAQQPALLDSTTQTRALDRINQARESLSRSFDHSLWRAYNAFEYDIPPPITATQQPRRDQREAEAQQLREEMRQEIQRVAQPNTPQTNNDYIVVADGPQSGERLPPETVAPVEFHKKPPKKVKKSLTVKVPVFKQVTKLSDLIKSPKTLRMIEERKKVLMSLESL